MRLNAPAPPAIPIVLEADLGWNTRVAPLAFSIRLAAISTSAAVRIRLFRAVILALTMILL